MNIKRTCIKGVLGAAAMMLISLPASADRDPWREGGHRGGRDGFREGFREHHDIRRFDRHDFAVWRGGYWHHGRHGGRLGWWWVVGGVWYFYPAPVYPYPDPYVPPVVVNPSAPILIEPPPAQKWYFCTSANAYYPYVSSCPEGWKEVPATPNPEPAPIVPPATSGQ